MVYSIKYYAILAENNPCSNRLATSKNSPFMSPSPKRHTTTLRALSDRNSIPHVYIFTFTIVIQIISWLVGYGTLSHLHSAILYFPSIVYLNFLQIIFLK